MHLLLALVVSCDNGTCLKDEVAWAGAIGSSRWDLALQLQHAAKPSQICGELSRAEPRGPGDRVAHPAFSLLTEN